MSTTAQEDLVVASKIRFNRHGYWAERMILVYGLDPAVPTGPLFGITLPKFGGGGTVAIPTWSSGHPTIIGAYCIELDQHPFPHNSREQSRIVASYGPGEYVNQWKITVSGSNGYKTLAAHADGTPIEVHYPVVDFENIGGVDAPVAHTLTDFGACQYLAPGTIVTFEHDEFVKPWSKIQAFKSTTNSVPFLGYDKGQVLCRDIQAESFSSFTSWHVRYIFEIDPSGLGWNQLLMFKDAYTGRIPGDVSGTDGSNGILKLNPYEEAVGIADFNALSLPTSMLM